MKTRCRSNEDLSLRARNEDRCAEFSRPKIAILAKQFFHSCEASLHSCEASLHSCEASLHSCRRQVFILAEGQSSLLSHSDSSSLKKPPAKEAFLFLFISQFPFLHVQRLCLAIWLSFSFPSPSASYHREAARGV